MPDIAINNGKAYFERIKSNMCHGLEEPGASRVYPYLLRVCVCAALRVCSPKSNLVKFSNQ